MRRRLPTLLLCALLFGLLAGCGEDVANLQSPTLARVGQTNITVADYSAALRRNGQGILQQGATPEQARQAIYERLVLEAVFLNEARRAGFGADAEAAAQVDQTIDRNTQPTGKGITFADYQAFARTNNFSSTTELRTDILRQTTLDRYVRTLQADTMSQRAKVSVIVVAAQDETDESMTAAKQQADDLLAQLRGGASFAALAQQYSADPESAAKGGEVGFLDLSQMPPDLGAALESLAVNQVSEPYKAAGAWFIMTVTERIAGFIEWQEMLQAPQGQAYIQQKMADYSASGELQQFIKLEDLPLP